MPQKYTKARKDGNRKWDAANLDRMSLALPKGSRDTIKAHAATRGESVNAFIKRAVDCQMERDSDGTVVGGPDRAVARPQEAAGGPQGSGGISLVYLYPLTYWRPSSRPLTPQGRPCQTMWRGLSGRQWRGTSAGRPLSAPRKAREDHMELGRYLYPWRRRKPLRKAQSLQGSRWRTS